MNPRPDKVYLLVGIMNLDISVRLLNVLRSLGANNILDILILGKEGLMKHKNCGKKTLNEAKNLCEVYGYTLPEKSTYDLNGKSWLLPSQIESLTCSYINV
jgi:DNA-directed RNA polymerase alpha subunit